MALQKHEKFNLI